MSYDKNNLYSLIGYNISQFCSVAFKSWQISHNDNAAMPIPDNDHDDDASQESIMGHLHWSTEAHNSQRIVQ